MCFDSRVCVSVCVLIDIFDFNKKKKEDEIQIVECAPMLLVFTHKYENSIRRVEKKINK